MESQKQCSKQKKKIAIGVPTREEVEEYFNNYKTKAKHRATLGVCKQLQYDESPEKFTAEDLTTIVKDVSELSLSQYYTPHEDSSVKATQERTDTVIKEVSQMSSLPYYTPNESVQQADSTNVTDSLQTEHEKSTNTSSRALVDTSHENFSNNIIETSYELDLCEREHEPSLEEIIQMAHDISKTIDIKQDIKFVSNPFETAYESSFEEITQTVGDILKNLHLEAEEDSCIVISDDEEDGVCIKEENVKYKEEINISTSSDTSCHLDLYIKEEPETDSKMYMTETSTNQAAESHISSECEQRLHDDSSFNLNDTLDEINQLLAAGSKELDCSKDSGSCSALTTPYTSKIPLIVTPTRPLNKENKPQQGFKLPIKPTPKRVQPKFKDIKSPVALYIKNAPLAPLQRKLPAKPIKIPSPAVSSEKRPPLQEVLSLPQVVYVPAQKKVTTHEKPVKLPQVISKHMSPRGHIIKHEKRTNANSRDMSKLLSDNNITINTTTNDDVSLLHVKEDFIV